MEARKYRAGMLAVLGSLASIAMGAALSPASAQELPAVTADPLNPDATATLPEVRIDQIEVLGPSTVRVHGTVDPNGHATDAFLQYGDGGVLGLKSSSISLGAGLDPVQFVTDLVNLEPGSAYDLRLVAETPAGTTQSATAKFRTGSPISVSPITGKPTVSAKATRCTITGTAGRDVIKGTSRRDVICGLGGNDSIRGLAGNDLILGGTGKDRLVGAGGRDSLRGNSGNDTLSGGAGNDRLWGDAGRDRLIGGKGADRLTGGRGRDRATVTKSDRVRSVERVSR
jgi:hypothetical protein